ncbi:MAG TPA: MXAN_6577-like cysteine-rich protein [Anaeromyxobacter sp.]
MMKKNALLVLIVVPLLAAMGCTSPGVAKTCLPGSVDCGNGCVQLQEDQLNCGVCGNVCGAGSVCSTGACALSCQAGLTNCSGSCRDAQTDVANCGACGTACAAGQVCSAGACALSCQAGLTNCSGSCRDLTTDGANCGACGNVCGVGTVCQGSTCVFSRTGITPPSQCVVGSDPQNPAVQWTVCSADANGAWISQSSAGGGRYHPDWICKSLGYRTFGAFGGNCGNVCGFCVAGTTCSVHGPATFQGSGTCGAPDAWGTVLCNTVMWLCVN